MTTATKFGNTYYVISKKASLPFILWNPSFHLFAATPAKPTQQIFRERVLKCQTHCRPANLPSRRVHQIAISFLRDVSSCTASTPIVSCDVLVAQFPSGAFTLQIRFFSRSSRLHRGDRLLPAVRQN